MIFNSATNQLTSTVPCASLFAFNGAAKARCSWTSNAALKVTFPAFDGSTPYAEPQQQLRLLSNTIKAQCSAGADCSAYAFSSAQNITIARPTNAVNPVVVIAVPRVVVACANVTVDASLSSGHGGRPWKSANWVVRANVPGIDTSELQNRLNGLGTKLAESLRFLASRYATLGVQYTISLSVTNFLGRSSSASVVFTLSDNPNFPIVQILGDTAIAVSPLNTITVFASSGKSVCAEKSVIFTTFWTVYASDNSVVNFRSTSVNPNVLLLPSHSLSPGSRYRVVVTTSVTASVANPAVSASAEAYVSVSTGKVVAVVRGGSSRLVLPAELIYIDASNSYDENVASSAPSQLTFKWTCTFLSTARFGQSCNNMFANAQIARAAVLGTTLSSSEAYSFTVQVAAPDGRAASKSITLQIQDVTSSTSVSINSAPIKVNANQRLTLSANLRANYGLTGTWSVSNGGSALALTTATPATSSFGIAELASGTEFSLLVPANQLNPGSTVTFRLTADRTGSTSSLYRAFSEVNVLVNAPPSSGSLVVTPVIGEALTTPFDNSAGGWIDDPADLPLSYMFLFTAHPNGSPLVIQSRQSSSAVTALLPAGNEVDQNLVSLMVTVFDNLLAFTSAAQAVTVNPLSNEAALTDYVNDVKQLFAATQDTSQAILFVNNVATTINTVNCTVANATFCASRNRQPCATEPNTCSSCLEGFVGVFGNSNFKCLPTFASNFNRHLRDVTESAYVGNTCTVNSDCVLGDCTKGICVAPVKLCPSSDPSTVCSGNGACVYSDNTGNMLSSACTVFDTQCFATCACADSFAGYDCSLTTERFQELDSLRLSLCETFLQVAALSNPSATLLESSVESLLAAFDPNQVASSNTSATCGKALQAVAQLAGTEGLLADASSDTVTRLLTLAAQFTQVADPSLGRDGADLDVSLQNISMGVLNSMVNGQADIAVASGTLKFVATKTKTGQFSTLAAPRTEEEIAYNAAPAAVMELTDSVGAACDAGIGYVDVALTQWGINPFPGAAERLKAPMIKFESSVPAATVPTRRTLASASAEPSYYITLSFNQPQNLTLEESLQKGNVTFPECTVYDAATKAYTSCNGCEVSTYSDNDVTFVCYDVSRLCNAGPSAANPLVMQLQDELHFSRELQITDDDYLGNAEFSTQTSFTSVQYSALVTTFANVLSTNIFKINYRAAKVTISVMAILVGVIIIGFLYFRAWDVHDHNKFLYKYKELPHMRLKRRKDRAQSIRAR